MRVKWIILNLIAVSLLAGALCGCRKSFREPPITGKPTDPPTTLRATWQPDQRYIYRVDAVNSTQLPRKNTTTLIRAEVTVGQDLGLTVTNVAPDGSRTLLMELLAIQMETSADDRVSMTFDSENKAFFYEDSALAEKLQKLVGGRLVFRLSPDNKITRVDGAKEFNARTSGGSNVRGVAGGVFNRFFSVQFFREVIEMGMLPADAVKVGDKWAVSRAVSSGLWGTSAVLDMNYEFKGWQFHDGTNCARLDFSGVFKPNSVMRTNAAAGTNQNLVRRMAAASTPSNLENGIVSGRSWFDPAISLPVETVYEQEITTRSTTSKRTVVQTVAGTNAAVATTNVVVTIEEDTTTDTNAPPPVANVPPPSPGAKVPVETVTTKTSMKQQTILKLIAIEPLAKPAAATP